MFFSLFGLSGVLALGALLGIPVWGSRHAFKALVILIFVGCIAFVAISNAYYKSGAASGTRSSGRGK